MAPITDRKSFSYTPLPDPDIYIRLIEIDTENEDGEIRCNLTTWLTEEAPSYQAISYTWGEATSTTRIFISGKELQVRINCEYALRQASWHGGSQYFWIDSICINQPDDTERSRQVARMDQIFRNAINVLACLGPHADNSEKLMEFLGEYEEYLVKSNSDPIIDVPSETRHEQMVRPKYASGIRKYLHGWRNKMKRRAINPLKENKIRTRRAVPHDDEHDSQECIGDSEQETHGEQQRRTFADGERGFMKPSPPNPYIIGEWASDNADSIYIKEAEMKVGPRIDIKYIFSLWRWRLLKIPDKKFCAVSKAFLSLVSRPYFSRVWVMQEVFLAQKLSLCCGPDHQSMATLRGLDKGLKDLYTFVFIQVEYLTKLLNSGEPSSRLKHHMSRICWRLYFSTGRIPFLRLLAPSWLMAYTKDFLRVCEGPNVILDSVLSNENDTKLMTFHEAVVKMRHLNCQDNRDRVYGALGCIDWEGATPVVPDYTKTIYQLAIEMLQVKRVSTVTLKREAGKVVNVITKPGTSHTALTLDIAQTLRISSLDADVDAGLELRRAEQEAALTSLYGENPQEVALLQDDDWFGYRLTCDDSLDLASHSQHKPCILHEGSADNVEHSQDMKGIEDLRKLKSANGYVIGLLPAGARSGDWVLYKRPWSKYHNNPPTLTSNIGLIVRFTDETDRVSIIGQALVDDLWECTYQSPEGNEFSATFSAQDLFLLQVDGGKDKGWRDLDVEEVRRRLLTRVCYPEGSSYVRKCA